MDLPSSDVRVVARRMFDFGREVEEVEELVVGEVEVAQEVGGGGFEDLVGGDHGGQGADLV